MCRQCERSARRLPAARRPAAVARWRRIAPGSPLRNSVPSRRVAPLILVAALKGMVAAIASGDEVATRTVPGECRDRPAFRRLVAERSQVGDLRRIALRDPRQGDDGLDAAIASVMVPVLSSRSVSTLAAASTAAPDFAIMLRAASRPMPTIPITERRPAVAVGSMAPNRAIRRAVRSAPCRRRGHRDAIRAAQPTVSTASSRSGRVSRSSVRLDPPSRVGDQLTHLGEGAVAQIRGHFDLEPVRQDPRATEHRGAIAAAFADDRSGFAGYRGFVDLGHAVDHLAVDRDDVAGLHQDDVADVQGFAGSPSRRANPRAGHAA